MTEMPERRKPGPKKKPKPNLPDPPEEKIYKQMGRPKGSKNLPKPKKEKVDYAKVAHYAKRGRPREIDRIKPPLSFIRPPAVYSNTSPYGIAAEMLAEQLKKVS